MSRSNYKLSARRITALPESTVPMSNILHHIADRYLPPNPRIQRKVKHPTGKPLVITDEEIIEFRTLWHRGWTIQRLCEKWPLVSEELAYKILEYKVRAHLIPRV